MYTSSLFYLQDKRIQSCCFSTPHPICANCHTRHSKKTFSLIVLSVLHSIRARMYLCKQHLGFFFSSYVNNLPPRNGSDLVLNHTTVAAGFLSSHALLHYFFFFLSTWGNSGSSVIPLLSIITDVSDTAFQEYTRNTDCH